MLGLFGGGGALFSSGVWYAVYSRLISGVLGRSFGRLPGGWPACSCVDTPP